MYLKMTEVAALNALAAALPGVKSLTVVGDGVAHEVVRVGVGGGWMVDPPALDCATSGHETGSDPSVCLWCGKEL